jgi:hypothetical protein
MVRGLASEVVVPVQGPNPGGRGAPERRLLVAVLEQALDDVGLVRSTTRTRPRARRLCGRRGANVEVWFAARNEPWPLSFENLCSHLGLDADAIRTALSISCE